MDGQSQDDAPRSLADAGQRRRRKRDRSAEYRGGAGLTRLFRAEWFDRACHIVVGTMAVAYLLLMIDRFHGDSVMLGFRPIDAPKAEILYGFGRPEWVSGAGGAWVRVEGKTRIHDYDRWRYSSDGGGIFQFHYGADGRSKSVSCSDAEGDYGACPAAFWVTTGDSEDRLAYQLGAAPVRVLRDTSAVLRYPSIGVDFELRQFRVHRITITSNKSPVFGRIPRFIRFLIP